MMYHKNRLIKAYERVGCQLQVSLCCFFITHVVKGVFKCYHPVFMFLNFYPLQANNQGVGVIAVIECDYLEPTHNKQSFNETDKYR